MNNDDISSRLSLPERIRRDGRKVVVLDDDPTGTQTVSDVEVILRPDPDAFRAFMRGGRQAVFVLTNTRAMPRDEAVRLLRRIRTEMDRAAEEVGANVAYVLRGDSTLRGHIFAEMEALIPNGGVGLLVPAFPECGRITVDGVHYLQDGGSRRPVNETEFARDATFGYRSRTLADWVDEVGGSLGWKSAPVALGQLRTAGSGAVREALLLAGPRTVVIPDAETEADIALIAEGLLDAELAGAVVAARGASTLARIRCGLNAKPVASAGLTKKDRILAVCGSHTAAASRQLARLAAYSGAEPVVLSAREAMEDDAERVASRLAERLIAGLRGGGFAILATEREREPQYGDLAAGARVMKALTSTVRLTAADCDGVISKGGITSAQIATDGLGAATAEVLGQLEAGVAVWRLRSERLGRDIPYAVIPGNVGDDETMVHAAKKFGFPVKGRRT